MEILPALGKALLVLFAVASVGHLIVSERHNYQFVWLVARRFRIRMFFECLVVVALTITTVATLWQIPGFSYGWTHLFFGESGNMLIKPIIEGSESSSILVRLMVPAYFMVFAFTLPFLAHVEEKIFRKGHNNWSSIVKQSVKFGFMHCLVGIPLAGGFALIIPGLFFGLKYKQALNINARKGAYQTAEDEAVMVSTTYHTLYNLIVFGLILHITIAAI